MGTGNLPQVEWRLVGPHRGGRVAAVAGHPDELGTFYFGGCAGGVWKTTNAGSHWENISDGYFNTAAIGALAVSDADPNVIYAGTGETALRNNISHGDGVYKSTDGGRSWINVGLKNTRHIGEIQIHPGNPDIVYVAAFGHAWGENEERGVYRTQDGGRSWEKVLYKSPKAGAADISIDPGNPRIIFATIWEGQRYPYGFSSGGPDSGLWRSMDGGDTWEEITGNPGLPEGIWGKSGVAVSGAKAGRVWAQIEAHDTGVFRSDDYGTTWKCTNLDPAVSSRPFYYMHIFADPGHADTVWIADFQCWKSTDSGRTFEQVRTPHVDNHDLWIDPNNTQRMINGNDGGACVSLDGGGSWSTILNQPTAQFYHVEIDNQFPYHLYGSQQDNYGMRLPSSDPEGAISWKNYYEPGGGESGYMRVQPEFPHTVFGGGVGTGFGHGRLIAWDPVAAQRRNVTVWPETHGMKGVAAAQLKYRFQWTFPIEFSPHDPSVLYVCSNHVHRSTDLGHSWEVLSPDLTRNFTQKMQPTGGPLTSDAGQAEFYCTIFSFLESPHEQGLFWAGSDDGLIHISLDAGATWKNVTPGSLPEWSLISMIEASPHDPGTIYVAATRYKHDDPRPLLYKTSDHGETWTEITNGIPENDFTRVIREDPARRGLLYSGTETGVYVSFDDGGQWTRLESNLPVVPIHDLVIANGDLIAATHGRSFWILDDLSPLHQLTSDIQPGSSVLFKPRDTYRYRFYGRPQAVADDASINYFMNGPVTVSYRSTKDAAGNEKMLFLDAGSNPPDGVIIHYYVPPGTRQEIALTFLDADDSWINSYSSESTDAPWVPVHDGFNRFVWDLRGTGPLALADGVGADSRIAKAEESVRPRVPPGDYKVRLTAGSKVITERFRILRDPRLTVADEDLRAQFQLKTAIRDLVSEVSKMVNQIRLVRSQVEHWAARAEVSGKSEDIGSLADALTSKLTHIERELVQLTRDRARPPTSSIREKLIALASMIDESDANPTESAYSVFELLSTQADTQRQALEQVTAVDVAEFSQQVAGFNVRAVLL